MVQEQKQILIVSKFFYPLNNPRAFRTTELAKEMARNNHKVTVLAPYHDALEEFGTRHNIEFLDIGKAKWKEINIKRGPFIMLKRALRRILQLSLSYPELELTSKVNSKLKKIKKEGRNYDLLISIAVPFPIHWGVALNWDKSEKNIAKTWVADCGDPFMGAENDTFKPFFYFKYVEKWFCKKVDYLTVPVETAIPAYYKEFHHKIKVIPQGFNFKEVSTGETNKKPYPHFAYAGALIPGRRDPKAFLEYLVGIETDYKFDIYTTSVHLVKDYADRSNGRIEIKDYIPRLKLLFNMSQLDFVVNFENAGQKQMPSKLIDYSIIKKPILSINSFDFNPKITDEFLIGNYSNAYEVKNVEQYKIENVAQSFLDLI